MHVCVFLHERTGICVLVIYDREASYAPFEEAEQRDVCVPIKHICFLDQRSAIWNCLSAGALQSSLSRVPYFQLTIYSETIKNKVFACHGPADAFLGSMSGQIKRFYQIKSE